MRNNELHLLTATLLLCAPFAALARPAEARFSVPATVTTSFAISVQTSRPDAKTQGGQLAETPLDAELLGFRMRIPVGTSVRIERNPTTSFLLAEKEESPSWRIRAAEVIASREGTTSKGQCDDYLADLRKREQKFNVIASEARAIASTAAHLLYISVPLEGGGSGVLGMLVVPNGKDNYLVLSLVVSDGEFARVRPLLERAFATIELVDRGGRAAENTDLLARGAALFARISPEALRATISEPRVYRMWRPDDRGGKKDAKKDYGYLVVRVREGMQGEVDATKDPAKFKGEDAETGLLASIDARVVVNDDPTHTLDAQSRYFVRWDRASEAWSIRSTERQKRASRSSAQTGLRLAPTAGAPKPVLQVITASGDGMTREPQQWDIPPVYLSQAELIVLGELLPRDGSEPRIEFKDYAYDQRDQKLPQRRESWFKTASGWRLETQQGSAPAKIVQEFDSQGRRVRRTDVDGSVTELIELEELRKLWKSKGLPVD